MKCLRCDNTQMEVQVKGKGADIIEIDVCPACKGIWLDAKELSSLDDNFFVNLEEITYEKVVPSGGDAQLKCNRCDNIPMNKVQPSEFKDVVLDICPSCKGFWLDKGELEKMREVSDKLLIASLLSDE